MKVMPVRCRPLRGWVLLIAILPVLCGFAGAQSSAAPEKPDHAAAISVLEHEFWTAIREGDAKKVLSYIPQRGVNLGSQAQAATREEVEQQFLTHSGLYCKLFDSSCIDAPIDLANSARTCSDRELLTRSKKVRTASSEITRNGVRQAVLVARITNDQCPRQELIDFIFNLDADGWKLFSIP